MSLCGSNSLQQSYFSLQLLQSIRHGQECPEFMLFERADSIEDRGSRFMELPDLGRVPEEEPLCDGDHALGRQSKQRIWQLWHASHQVAGSVGGVIGAVQPGEIVRPFL